MKLHKGTIPLLLAIASLISITLCHFELKNYLKSYEDPLGGPSFPPIGEPFIIVLKGKFYTLFFGFLSASGILISINKNKDRRASKIGTLNKLALLIAIPLALYHTLYFLNIF